MSVALVIDDIARSVDWRPATGSLRVTGTEETIASRHPVCDIAAGAYGALALAAADYARGAAAPMVDRGHAGLAMAGNEYLRVDGEAPQSWDPITGFYACADGRWIYLHGNFPHHRDGLLRLFGAESTRESMAARLALWQAEAAEEAAQSAGLCAIMTRSRAEWEAHPQRAALAEQPVLRIVDIAPPPARRPAPRAPGAGDRPLSGIRVLDLSRVIAGPMAGRALAELGADVLRIGAAHLPTIAPLTIDTGFGKRAADIDLRGVDGRATLRRLVEGADIVIDGFRPGALDAKGFGPEALAAVKADITVVTLSAFSDVGPWAGRRGYDSYVQGAAGLTLPDTPGAAPVRLACQPLDYLTGCLGALGAVRALTARRATGGGARLVETSLARTAMWFWDMSDAIGPVSPPPERNLSFEDAEARGWIRRMNTDFGAVAALGPPYRFSDDPMDWAGPPPRPDARAARWG